MKNHQKELTLFAVSFSDAQKAQIKDARALGLKLLNIDDSTWDDYLSRFAHSQLDLVLPDREALAELYGMFKPKQYGALTQALGQSKTFERLIPDATSLSNFLAMIPKENHLYFLKEMFYVQFEKSTSENNDPIIEACILKFKPSIKNTENLSFLLSDGSDAGQVYLIFKLSLMIPTLSDLKTSMDLVEKTLKNSDNALGLFRYYAGNYYKTYSTQYTAVDIKQLIAESLIGTLSSGISRLWTNAPWQDSIRALITDLPQLTPAGIKKELRQIVLITPSTEMPTLSRLYFCIEKTQMHIYKIAKQTNLQINA
jgi:hypothetical protein